MQKPKQASRIDRLVAIIVDAFVVMILCVPVFYYTGIDDIAEIPRTASMSENTTTRSLVFATVFMVINIYFLRTEGQTIGKRGRKIKIVNNDGTKVRMSTIVIRYVIFLFAPIVATIGDWIGLLNIVLIFAASKRCGHDWIARTKVVRVESSTS